MTCYEDIQIAADNEGFPTAREFIRHYIVDEQWSFWQLKSHMETVHRRYYSVQAIRVYARMYYNGPLSKRIVEKKKRPYELRLKEHGSFKSKKVEARWRLTAKYLGFKNVIDMLENWQGTEKELAKHLGIGYAALNHRRSILKIKRGDRNK